MHSVIGLRKVNIQIQDDLLGVAVCVCCFFVFCSFRRARHGMTYKR